MTHLCALFDNFELCTASKISISVGKQMVTDNFGSNAFPVYQISVWENRSWDVVVKVTFI